MAAGKARLFLKQSALLCSRPCVGCRARQSVSAVAACSKVLTNLRCCVAVCRKHMRRVSPWWLHAPRSRQRHTLRPCASMASSQQWSQAGKAASRQPALRQLCLLCWCLICSDSLSNSCCDAGTCSSDSSVVGRACCWCGHGAVICIPSRRVRALPESARLDQGRRVSCLTCITMQLGC